MNDPERQHEEIKLRRILKEQKRKMAKLTSASRRLQRAAPSSVLDLDSNPFCEGKQRRDWHEMQGSRTVKRTLAPGQRKQRSSGNSLRDVLNDTLASLGNVREDYDDQKGISFRGGRFCRRPASPGSPGSPGSPRSSPRQGKAPAHMDVLTLIKDESRDLEKRAAEELARKTLPRAGLLNADDLYRLVHAPKRKPLRREKAASTKESKTALANAQKAELRKGWNGRIYDASIEQSKDTTRRCHVEINAVFGNGIRKEPKSDMKSYVRRMNEIASVDRLEPFCSERQIMDKYMASKPAFMSKKEYQLADKLFCGEEPQSHVEQENVPEEKDGQDDVFIKETQELEEGKEDEKKNMEVDER